VSVLSFPTGGRAGAEFLAVSVVASVPATRRAASCEVARQRHGAAIVAVWARARAFRRTSTTCGSRGEGRVVVARTSWRGVACVGMWLTSDGLWLCCCAMSGGDGGALHRSSRGKRPAYGCHAATAVADGTALPLRATTVNMAASRFGVVTFPDYRGGWWSSTASHSAAAASLPLLRRTRRGGRAIWPPPPPTGGRLGGTHRRRRWWACARARRRRGRRPN